MDPIVTGSLISGGASLLGGIFGRGGSGKKLAREQMAMQKEFAQHGVRWRVEDAKAAGIHPLAALGMQSMSYSPVYAQASEGIGSSLAEAGQHIGRAVAAQSTAVERRMQLLGLAAAEKSLEEADARIGALRSEEFRNMQEANAAKSFPVPDPFWDQFGSGGSDRLSAVPESVVPVGTINPVSPDVVAHTVGDVSTMAGATPIWRNFNLRPGMQIALPGGKDGDAAEVLESLTESPLLMAVVIDENVRRFGPGWLKQWQLFTGDDGVPWYREPDTFLRRKFVEGVKGLNSLLNRRWESKQRR